MNMICAFRINEGKVIFNNINSNLPNMGVEKMKSNNNRYYEFMGIVLPLQTIL